MLRCGLFGDSCRTTISFHGLRTGTDRPVRRTAVASLTASGGLAVQPYGPRKGAVCKTVVLTQGHAECRIRFAAESGRISIKAVRCARRGRHQRSASALEGLAGVRRSHTSRYRSRAGSIDHRYCGVSHPSRLPIVQLAVTGSRLRRMTRPTQAARITVSGRIAARPLLRRATRSAATRPLRFRCAPTVDI